MSKTKEFGEILKELIKNKNITQNELADKLKIGKSSLSMYINGKQLPKWDVLKEIASIFNVTTDYLLGNDDLPPKSDDNREVIHVPVFKNIKFSDKIDSSNENIIRWIPVPAQRFKDCNTLFFKEVVTDEMNPLLFKGDLVLFEIIRPGIDKIYTGDICLCTKGDNDAVIREMVNTESGYVFNLMNVNMPPRPRTLKRIKEEDINIVAKALEFVHIFPYRGPVNE